MKMVLGWVSVIVGFLIVRIIFKLLAAKRIGKVGFAYVYMKSDGTLRRLNGKEKNYLSQKFDPDKDALPNIKYKFRSKNRDGNPEGYIHVKRVPLWVKVP